jgi:hypothetical protein
MMNPHFMGLNGFVWWFGVVEDRDDPEELGRCRVRIAGFHTNNKQDLPTEDLPWAYPILPITSAAMSGIGQTPLGPVEGTWVFGFFRDGAAAQQPVMLGSVAGEYEDFPPTDVGFSDESQTYPRLDQPSPDRGRQTFSDMNPLAVGSEQDSAVEFRKDNVVENVLTAAKRDKTGQGENGNWQEPETPYAAQYPYNHVYESESGHVREFDDTQGAERIMEMHRSGTFYEIHPDGSKVTKIYGKNYTIVLDDDNVLVAGACNLTVEGDCRLLVGGDLLTEVRGDKVDVVHGNKVEVVYGTSATRVVGEAEIVTDASLIIKASGEAEVSADGNMKVLSAGTSYLQGSSGVYIDGDTVRLNEPTPYFDIHQADGTSDAGDEELVEPASDELLEKRLESGEITDRVHLKD